MNWADEEETPGLMQKLRPLFILLVITAVGVGIYYLSNSKGEEKTKRSSITMVSVMPPPPPPPPPPPKPEPTPPPPEPKQEEEPEEQMMQEEQIIDEAPPEENSEPEPDVMGTNNIGEGGPDYGLKAGGSGGIVGGRIGGSSGRGGSKFGWYAGKVQSRVAEALRSNKLTKSARFTLTARIWVNEFGLVTRATLDGSSGDPGLDAAIRDRILSGLQLPEPPPKDMPMPIVMRLNAKKAL